MCATSLKSRTCVKFGTGENCREGYHLKNTTNKSEVIQTTKIPNTQEVISQKRPSTNGSQVNLDTMSAFLEKIVEKQVLKILGVQIEEKKLETMDPLKALLSLMKAKN